MSQTAPTSNPGLANRLSGLLREKLAGKGILGALLAVIGFLSSEAAELANRYLPFVAAASGVCLVVGLALLKRARAEGADKNALEREMVTSGALGSALCGWLYLVPPEPKPAAPAPGQPVVVQPVVVVPPPPAPTDPREVLARRGTPWTAQAFHDAMRQGDLETLRLFLRAGMRPEVPFLGCTALWYAVANGLPSPREQFALFREYGFDVNAPQPCRPAASFLENSVPIIDTAILYRQAETTEVLLELGARVPRNITEILSTLPVVRTEYARQLGPKLERAPRR
jgi:hypothetical protein